MTKRIERYEIVNHGVEHEQYFQGCGVSFTKFDECVTGIGWNLECALEDCLEQLATIGYGIDGISTDELDDHGDCSGNSDEHHYYVSIRYSFVK